MYMVQLVDLYGVSMTIFLATLIEIICVVLGYGEILNHSISENFKNTFVGLRNICWDIQFMTMRKVNTWYKCVWGLIAPIVFIIVYILYLRLLVKENYMKTILYPIGATGK